jgi:hypothetical protein
MSYIGRGMSIASFVLLGSGKQYGDVVKQQECCRDTATIGTHCVAMISQIWFFLMAWYIRILYDNDRLKHLIF